MPLLLLASAYVNCNQDEKEKDKQGTNRGAENEPREGGGGGSGERRWGRNNLQGEVCLLSVKQVALPVGLMYSANYTAVRVL